MVKEASWKKETLWVARNEHRQIVRVSETSPEELLRLAEELKMKSKVRCDRDDISGGHIND